MLIKNKIRIGETKLSTLYQSMFHAKMSGNAELAESLMIAIEELRIKNRVKEGYKLNKKSLAELPFFVHSVLNKTQSELGKNERSNCINAAFNYHDSTARWETYSTMDFLKRIQSDFIQIEQSAKSQSGDLVVLWSRTEGGWNNRSITVMDIDPCSPDFPFGLVFDHVAVRINAELVFHKPDPTLTSRYQVEPLESILSVTSGQNGFEMTFHRIKCCES